MSLNLFRHRPGVLATMHRKEQVIAPILESELGVQIQLPQGFDSDRFGTFTRDIDRPTDQRQTARLKVEAALDLLGLDLGFASEGTFGPHPALPFMPCNRELVILVDRQHGLEVVGEAISTETNFSHKRVKSVEEAIDFAQQAGFPQHGLVVIAGLTATPQDASSVVKGITDPDQLQAAVQWALTHHTSAHLETDMRALYNPTRMRVIAQATRDLVEKLKQTCPQCGSPGFAAVAHQAGLPCGWCKMPTPLTQAIVYGCQKCGFQKEDWFPNGVKTADPGQCQYCNP